MNALDRRKFVAGAFALFGAFTVAAFQKPARAPLSDFDSRTKSAPVAEQKIAAAELGARVKEVKVEFDEITHSPKSVASPHAFLTGPNGEGNAVRAAAAAAVLRNDPHRATKAFLNEHRQLFGHGAEVISSTRIKRDFTTSHNGLTTVVWQQHVDEIDVFEAVLISHTTSKGELVNLSSLLVPSPEQGADRGTPKRRARVAQPIISAAEAIKISARHLGEETPGQEPTAIAGTDGTDKRQKFSAAFQRGESEAKLTWLATKVDSLRLCWDVVTTVQSRPETYRLLIDAETGEVLLRRCLTEYLTNATFRVYTSDSPSPLSPGHLTPLTNQPPVTARALLSLAAHDTNASPAGWINDIDNETRGNNVDAHLDLNNDNIADLPRPAGSPFRVFDFALDLAQPPSAYRNAAVVQLFYTCNWMHDRLYQLGFTEAAGNFQGTNFGRGGLGNDAVQADAQDGGGTDNANMSTPPDGSAPRMQMYVFSGSTPDRDGDFDSEIVLHEYTHGLSNRRVGGGLGLSALQSRGMGEGWSDWYAMTLLSESGDALNGNYAAGVYATYQFASPTYQQNYYFGIRRYPYSTDMTKNPLTFRDIDDAQASSHPGVPVSPVFGGGQPSEYHNQGEVWCVTLWEARANLVAKYGYTVGNEMILRLVTDGMNLSPPNPTFLQARDEIIQADLVANGGANRLELWSAFAKRGMGVNATSPASTTTSGVHESFDLPDDLSVSPANGFVSSGPVGGPFTPTTISFALTNTGAAAFNWTVANTSSWLNVSLASGTLTPGGPSASVTVSLNSSAALLPMGVYVSALRFTNRLSGIGIGREFMLRVGQPNNFTELFQGDFDLTNTTITFTPDGSVSFYAACRAPATNFPTDPTGGTSLVLDDDDYAGVLLTNTVAIYNRRTNFLYIGSNGYITAGSGDDEYVETTSWHFSLPRVAALFRDLNPEDGGTISWKQLSNRVAVTYQNVPEYGPIGANSFQTELFYDGRIRMTWLGMTARSGLSGLSAGNGVPAGFIETDLSALASCAAPLFISAPTNVTEGVGTLVGAGRVWLPAPLSSNLALTLSSSDTSEVKVLSFAVITAGQTNTTFDVTVVDDNQLDGTQSSEITAVSPGFASPTVTIAVHDNESTRLFVNLPASTTEGDGFVQGVVYMTNVPAAPILVRLTSSDLSELDTASSVLIPAGQTSAVFTVTVLDDYLIDGPQNATITAQVQNWIDGVASMTVLDNEPRALSVSLPLTVYENAGTLVNVGYISLSGITLTNLTVALSSSDATKLNVPATLNIPSGESGAAFNLVMTDNTLVDGANLVMVTAAASGFATGSNTMTVLDDESPAPASNPSPPNLAMDVAYTVQLSWRTDAGVTNDVYVGTVPTLTASDLAGTTTGTNWTLPLLEPNTTYFWQIVSRKVGATAGPVWRFTTRGVHHFDVSAVPSPQLVAYPFPLQVTARDELDRVVTNYSGTVSLTAYAGSNHGSLFAEDFESGSITNWRTDATTYSHLVTNQTAAGGTRSLTMIGGMLDHYDGISQTFTGIHPSRLTFHVRASETNKAAAYFVAGDGEWNTAAFFHTGQDGTMGLYEDNGGWHAVPYVSNRWYKISLELNWPNLSVNYFVDDQLAITNIPFRVPITSITTLHLYNFDSTLVWLDEIEILDGAVATPLASTPGIPPPFVNGVSEADFTVLEPASNVVIVARDAAGNRGESGAFDVLLANDLSVAIVATPDLLAPGGLLTNRITVFNSGPSNATAVTLTNRFPSVVPLVLVAPSQGNCSVAAGEVTCALGSLAAGSQATVTLVTAPTTLGLITNLVSIGRGGIDPYASNNVSQSVAMVALPALTISDVAVTEGDSGFTAATFVVTLSPAPVTNVTVAFASSNGSALAGIDYVATNGVMTFAPGQRTNFLTVWVMGETNLEANETFSLVLTNATNALVTRAQGTATILSDDVPPNVYVRAAIGEPWSSEANISAMDRVFGSVSWRSEEYEFVNVSVLFSPNTRFIFLEGSDFSANELATFIQANRLLMESWVAAGGRLFINAAPNEGTNIDLGFGAMLVFPDGASVVNAADLLHPVFQGPFTPVGVSWSGSSFSHASIVATNAITLITNAASPSVVLAEENYGRGLVLFGGMTTDNFHSPQPEASNLRANILAYTATTFLCANCPPVFVTQPSNRFVTVGTTLRLAARASGSFPLSYCWRRYGTNLIEGPRFVGVSSAALTISNAIAGDSGSYSLVASNAFGVATSSIAQVTVTLADHFAFDVVPSPQIVGVPFSVRVAAVDGSNNVVTNFAGAAAFYASAALANASDAVVEPGFEASISFWTTRGSGNCGSSPNAFGNQNVMPTEGSYYAQLYTFSQYTVQVGDYSLISQQVDFTSVRDLTFDASLFGISAWGSRVKGEVRIDGEVRWTQSNAGIYTNQSIGVWPLTGVHLLELRIEVLVPGTTDSQVVAFDNLRTRVGVPMSITPTPSITFSNGLWTGLVTSFDRGTNVELSVRADALSGHSAPFHVLFSNQPPVFLVHPAPQTIVSTGATVNFSAEAIAPGAIVYQWQLNGTDLSGQTNPTLMLISVSTNDAGAYALLATNQFGSAISSTALLTVYDPAEMEFSIQVLRTNNSRVIEHAGVTGDDRGGIATSISSVFCNGDGGLGRFAIDDLSGGVNLNGVYDGLVSDLRSLKVYSLANGTARIGSTGGVLTTLLEHDGISGRTNGNVITLSAPITLIPNGGDIGFFSGYGRVVIHTGTRAFDIMLPSGFVTDRGPMAIPTHAHSETWAFWGVAEYVGSTLYIAYVRDQQTIVRTTVPSGVTSTIATFANLSDMASFTVSIPLGRWYFHFEGTSQFGGFDESLGYADALFNDQNPFGPPSIVTQPQPQTVLPGGEVTFNVVAVGTAPLAYRWRKNAVTIPSATNALLSLTNVQDPDAGYYSVVISNQFGSVTSSIAALVVLSPTAMVGVFDDPRYVDSSGGTGAESDTMQASIQALGFITQTFTNFDAAVNDYRTIIIPEQELRAILPDLSSGTRGALSNFVFSGGKLIISGSTQNPATPLLNALLGIAVVETNSPGGVHTRAIGSLGTEFATNSFTIADNNAMKALHQPSLPSMANVIYTNGTTASVVAFPSGQGMAIFLGWDWYDAAPVGTQDGGWNAVLASALRQQAFDLRFTEPPLPQNVLPGTNVIARALAVGQGLPSYQWRLNGTNILDATNASYSFTNAALFPHAGLYDVIATLGSSSVTSAPALIRVMVQPFFAQLPQATTVVQGQSAVFSVIAGPIHPTLPFGFRWLTLGGPLGTITNLNRDVLYVLNSQTNGGVRVIVTNAAGSAVSPVVQLTVLADNDRDGIADFWEVLYGLNTNNAADALLDFDGDGMSNRDEFLSGTNPTNALSVFKLMLTATNVPMLRFVARTNLGYTIEFRTNLTLEPWLKVTDILASPTIRTVEVNVPNPVPEPARIYRAVTPATP